MCFKIIIRKKNTNAFLNVDFREEGWVEKNNPDILKGKTQICWYLHRKRLLSQRDGWDGVHTESI